MDNMRGRWYWLCVLSFPLLILALRGMFGQEAKEESEVALADLGNAVLRLRYLLIALFTAAAAALLYEATR